MDYRALPRTVRANIKTTVLKYRFNIPYLYELKISSVKKYIR